MRVMIPLIVVIEDDLDLQKYLKDLLTENGFTVKTSAQGSTALQIIKSSEPDLVLLDLTLPDMSGESICMEIRKKFPTLPVIMLTAKDDIQDKVKGLTLGADDYITKPFVADELIARVKARLRHKGNQQTKLKIADLELDSKTVQVRRSGKLISLTPQEFKLLEYMMKNKGVVLTREMILNRIWLYSPNVETRVVDVYVGYLRKKIDSGHKKKLLKSIRGFGYILNN